jgi:hypothetical protein
MSIITWAQVLRPSSIKSRPMMPKVSRWSRNCLAGMVGVKPNHWAWWTSTYRPKASSNMWLRASRGLSPILYSLYRGSRWRRVVWVKRKARMIKWIIGTGPLTLSHWTILSLPQRRFIIPVCQKHYFNQIKEHKVQVNQKKKARRIGWVMLSLNGHRKKV